MVPPCDACVHFMPHLSNAEAKYHLGKCLLFGITKKTNASAIITRDSEYAVHCRKNVYQCGPKGTCFEPQKYRYFQ